MTTEKVVELNQEELGASQEASVEFAQDATAQEISNVEIQASAAQPEEAQTAGKQQGETAGATGPTLSADQQIALVEALLLASGDPLPISRIGEILGIAKSDVLAIAESLKQLYAEERRGLELVTISSKLQLRTKAVYAEYVRNLIAVRPRKLSQAALETLAVIAYQQPVVKSEVDKIRGVDVAPTVKTLLERKLVKILGYQASVGQPALYGTTEDFLSIFGLTSLAELPSLRDLKALVKEPGEALEEANEDEASEDDETVEGDASTTSSTEQNVTEQEGVESLSSVQ